MDSMDYHMENFPPTPRFVHNHPLPPRRCPYAVQAGSISHRNYHPQNGGAFLPSLQYAPQPSWTDAPLLPPPISSQFNYHRNTTHPHLPMDGNFSNNVPRGARRDQVSPQHTNMAENSQTRSSSSEYWVEQDAEVWRRASMAMYGGSLYNSYHGPHDSYASSNSHVLPPLLTTTSQSTRSTDITSTHGNASSESSSERRPQPTPGRQYEWILSEGSRNRARAPEETASPLTGNSHVVPSLTRESLSGSSMSSTTSEDLEAMHSYLTSNTDAQGIAQAAVMQDLLDQMIPPLENEANLRMDDPRRLQHAALRERLFRSVVNESRSSTKKLGASKTALESLLIIPIEDIEEDDRCKCFTL